jgi:2-methylisocitrate lyase-like PEP mutase family enzyme
MAGNRRSVCRRLLKGPRIPLALGAYDALSATLVQQAGFEAVT